ncbi:chloride channel protein [uncultured Eubacterium sp.]|uniref:chloride channel protein n=1 Tax=uncultured Eubacterium sp. TaxID=165185 RepID=UPI0025E5C5BD|nr:chloride channel protein [uncultured Eubacterium sp.]
MKKQMSNSSLFLCFTALTGAVIAGLVWLYLKIANVGITVIWEMIPAYIDSRYYTILMCLAGGVVIGLFHRVYGPFPERMADSVKRVKDTGSYPYRKLPMIVAASFLSLFFGGAVGPESGLVSLLLGLCCWAMDQFGLARWKMETLKAGNPYIMKKELFQVMAAGLFLPPDQIVYDKGKIEWKRKDQIAAGVTAGLTGLAVYELLNAFFGRCLSVPHLQGGVLLLRDKVAVVLLIIVGIASGYLFLIFQKLSNWFFGKMQEKHLAVLNAVLGGLILGLIGTALPMTMFSGGSDIQTMQYEYLKYTPYLLILIGVVKLFLTNVCIASGWRGGHFFPMIFSGLSIGYGFAAILHTNEIVSVVLVTGALMGTVLQQPLGALALSLVFFPMKNFGWMLLASAVGGCVPVPVALRTNPEKKGFVYNMIQMKKRGKFLSGKE